MESKKVILYHKTSVLWQRPIFRTSKRHSLQNQNNLYAIWFVFLVLWSHFYFGSSINSFGLSFQNFGHGVQRQQKTQKAHSHSQNQRWLFFSFTLYIVVIMLTFESSCGCRSKWPQSKTAPFSVKTAPIFG